MKYCFTLILNLLWLTSLFAQEELRLISSRYSTIIDQQGFSSIQPVYAHKGNTLSADSGIIYEDEVGRQFFEAFGNVVITQPSGTIIYSDRLHYDAAPQIATLTNNVRMVDANSVLTTNHLIYKMRDKIGNYTGGGRIISKGDTITSRTAYYFENTEDAYFRNQVVVRTPDVKIYTDTMRYNSNQRMTYFFGPTNIKGNSGENLYTEKGNYNTETGVANFSKNNLYTEGTRFLKGDSLYYDRATGVGKAYRNVVFVDTLDKFYAYGGYGLYDQADESITMTDKPLITMVVENDSTSSAPVDSLAITPADSMETDSTDIKKDTVAQAEITQTEEPDVTADNEIITTTDSTQMTLPRDTAKVDSVYMTADTLYSRMIMLRDYKALDFKLDRSGGEIETDEDVNYGDEGDYGADNTDIETENLTPLSDSIKTIVDSVSMDSISVDGIMDSILIDSTAIHREMDSLKTIVTEKAEEKLTIEKPQEIKKAVPVDSAKRATIIKEAARADISRSMRQDSILRQQAVIPEEATADSLINQAIATAQTPDKTFKDTTNEAYLDTARTRIVKAYYNVRMFKSDLQAVADSVYYGMADSMFRFMGRPMIWAEGSQISSDTIYMQIQNQRMDNALLINNAFMVNAVMDTVKFNQLKGRKITAFFANNSIDRMYVDGNAENLSFATNDKTHRITEMFHDRGARIKIKMEGKKIIDYITIRKVDQKLYPFKQVTQENEVLPGFVWRPQDRPKSKEDMMNRKREIEKPEAPAGSPQDENTLGTPDEMMEIDELTETSEEPVTQQEKEETPAQAEEEPETPITGEEEASKAASTEEKSVEKEVEPVKPTEEENGSDIE
ncbi:OstA-like protein [Sphingobacterium micropteri]|uniref:OstA-like protein n=1 Tax=Sphingobacterium micropteri TaxID=2763501 RepID=UPI00293BE7E8|nr:OstA-like protein [Sphingobacterium micropteri]